jgi:hypothetical protein
MISMAFDFGTKAETATQSGSSRGEIVGALLPGVIFVTLRKEEKRKHSEKKREKNDGSKTVEGVVNLRQ